MIKSAGELISEAQTKINCVDANAAKLLYQNSNNSVKIISDIVLFLWNIPYHKIQQFTHNYK